MCGIAGIIKWSGLDASDISCVKKMNDVQRHRGPDDEGIFHDKICALGHCRLSIIDLSKNGHQPFFSDDNNLVMIYNGEIYNYLELREELVSRGWRFKTNTDTEVLLKAYQEYGKDCLHKLNGMFAFVIYDMLHKQLFFARDRVGIKPLYYTKIEDAIIFASEIKALRLIPGLRTSINNQALFDYLVFNRTDVYDETFTKEFKRIPKGHYAIYDEEGLSISEWWNAEHFISTESPQCSDTPYILENIKNLLTSSIRLRMRSDVPAGSCLSGGLDSSIITGLLFEEGLATKGYPTFTASFPGHSVDESHYVAELNHAYPFINHQTFPNSQGAYDNLETFVYTNDEPSTGASFYSQYEVMRIAKEKGVTVLLDGQGGDESFAGYQYFHGFYLYELLKKKNLTSFLREFSNIILRHQDKSAYQTFLFQVLPASIKKKILLKTTPYLKPDFFYQYIKTSRIYHSFFDAPSLNMSLVRHFQYKLEHLLRTEDRNSMAFSLEARVPYLDHRLVEFLLSVSGHLKILKGETKYLQKKALGKYSIPAIVNRKDKIGFGTPMSDWLATDFWKERTRNNHEKNLALFPDIFNRDSSNETDMNSKWKCNQLATWHKK